MGSTPERLTLTAFTLLSHSKWTSAFLDYLVTRCAGVGGAGQAGAPLPGQPQAGRGVRHQLPPLRCQPSPGLQVGTHRGGYMCYMAQIPCLVCENIPLTGSDICRGLIYSLCTMRWVKVMLIKKLISEDKLCLQLPRSRAMKHTIIITIYLHLYSDVWHRSLLVL